MDSTQRRETTLDLAKVAVVTDRLQEYGEPEDNFLDTAELWNGYLRSLYGDTAPLLNALDIANLMILLKMARLKTSPKKLDHYVDMAGYAACGASAAQAEA